MPARSAHLLERRRLILVLAGGGLKGAFQAGVLAEIAESLEEVDGIVGTSIGAWHACRLAQAKKSGFVEAARELPSLWTRYLKSPKDIYRYHKPKIVAGAYKHSFAHVRPLKQLMNKLIDPEAVRTSDIDIWLPAVDLHTGKTIVFGNDTDDLMQAAHASSAYPGVFPPRPIGPYRFTDGGVRMTAGLEVAIAKEATEVVVLHHARPHFRPMQDDHAFAYSMRCINIMADEVVRNDLSSARAYNRIAQLEAAIDTLPDGMRAAVRQEVGRKWKCRQVKVTTIGPKIDIGEGLEGDATLTRKRIQHGRDLGRQYAEALS
jgi:NTE family protein